MYIYTGENFAPGFPPADYIYIYIYIYDTTTRIENRDRITHVGKTHGTAGK